jgi:hypothetical protein
MLRPKASDCPARCVRSPGAAAVLTTVLIMAFPQIVLWLPNTMK